MGRMTLPIVAVVAFSIGSAEGRGSHGLGHRSWHSHGVREEAAPGFAHGGRRGDDAYMKAASQEREKLLSKLKSICRGC